MTASRLPLSKTRDEDWEVWARGMGRTTGTVDVSNRLDGSEKAKAKAPSSFSSKNLKFGARTGSHGTSGRGEYSKSALLKNSYTSTGMSCGSSLYATNSSSAVASLFPFMRRSAVCTWQKRTRTTIASVLIPRETSTEYRLRSSFDGITRSI